MAAAIAAADYGVRVVVIDEQHRPGGQIFRQPPDGFTDTEFKFGAGYEWAKELISRSEQHPGITWKRGTTAYGVLRDRADRHDTLQVAVHGMDGPHLHSVRRLLIATGAYDLPVAFPGWTLPGVVMAGAVQSFLKSQRLLIAERLVLAGSHPLLIVVADQLRAEGADVAEVAFARGIPTLPECFRSARAAPGHVSLLAETGLAVTRLMKAGVRINTRTIVTNAYGDGHVAHVRLARVDDDWQVIGHAHNVDATALVLGYGFQPSTELARQAGCAMRWDDPKGGWIVAHDEMMQTTSFGIYVAGEPTGVAGAEQSRAEGHLAGLAIANDLRVDGQVPKHQLADANRRVRSAARFSKVVQTLFKPRREGLAALATPTTTVCRCELITRAEVSTTLANNPYMSTASAVKLECRSGMGPCQGRYCESTVSAIVATERRRTFDQVGYFTAHLPVKPVPVEALASLDRA